MTFNMDFTMTVNQTLMVSDTQYCQEDKFKTRLCKSYAVGGDENCKYGVNCKFIHPEDEEQYMRLIEYTEEYRRVKGEVQKEVQHLHGLKRTIKDAITANAIDERINRRIRLFNEVYPKAPNYYDLHGMSTRGAVNYVMDICNMMRINNISTSWLETGRGNHSIDNIPLIRNVLLNNYNGFNNVYFVPLAHNDGIIEMTIV
ncbi:hypothetical protein B9Z55_012295 [Caenorhabditis nigoni]|uniref:C3H1-type domain-containing protein n=2 Tax=Caenorhabditis nigoni TaxID=1611254 RepID=A0A2G5TWJ0_9PELO|nr:hypothetical protein B9Z55_012295 [Caenorhabditis nigoni]